MTTEESFRAARRAVDAGHWSELPKLYREAHDDAKNDPRIKDMLALALFNLGNYAELLQIPGIDRSAKLCVLADDLRQNELGRKHQLVDQGPPLGSAAYVAMIKDEDDVVWPNLLWHYSLGFRRFVLVDNGSTDATRALIGRFAAAFADTTVIVIDDPVVGYLQAEFTTAAFRVACSLWPEVRWVFPVDADEFLCAERPLEEILSGLPEETEGILLPKSQYLPIRDYYSTDPGAPFFHRIRHREPLSHKSFKVAVRSRVQYQIQQGNHGVTADGQEIRGYVGGLGLGLHYREFFLRSLDHTRKKVINGGRAIEAAEALGRKDIGGSHWKDWYGIYLREGEAGIRGIFESHFRDPSQLIFDPFPLDPVLGRWESLCP